MNIYEINTQSIVKTTIIFAAIIVLFSGQLPAAQFWDVTREENQKGNYVTGEILLKFRDNTPAWAQLIVVEKFGNQDIKTLDQQGLIQLIKLKGDQDVYQAIADFQDDPNVLYAQPNFIYKWHAVPNDPLYNQQWGLMNNGQTVSDPPYEHNNPGIAGMDMDVEAAWNHITDCYSVIVAILDSGVNYTHMDLAANMWNGGDDFPKHGWDFVQDDNDPMPADGHSHGTHVAGIIGAVGNNGTGITGICWDVELMALRAGDASGPTSANVLQAIEFAVANGARIINMSFGSEVFDDPLLENAINHAWDNGVLIVASAGNNGNNNDQTGHYPSSYTIDNIIAVAALDQAYELADFSNFGAESVDVGAPGTNILSTIAGITIIDDFSLGWSMSGDWANSPCDFGFGVIDMLVNPSDWCSNGLYANNADDRAYKQFDLSDYLGASFQYIAFIDTERYFDFFSVASRDSGGDPFVSDTQLKMRGSGSTLPYAQLFRHDLFGCLTPQCSIGFRLTSDSSITRSGLGIFNFQIDTAQPNSNSYIAWNGTSMAAPHVAGLAALIWAYNPDYSYLDVASSIKNGGKSLSALAGLTTTGKAVNAMGSLKFINQPTGVTLRLQQ